MKNLCPHSELKSAFNQLYNNRPGIQLTNQSDSAAQVHQIWTEDNIKQFQDCVFTIDSNLYFENGRYGRGMFIAVPKINFRQKPNGECIDFVRFTFDGVRSEKICGEFDADSELGKNAFFNEGGGIIKVHIFVNKSIPLQGLQRSVEIDLLFTAYERRFCNYISKHFLKKIFSFSLKIICIDCSSSQSFVRCHPTEDDFCISGVFKNDGIHNCPPPHSSDEPKLEDINNRFNQQNQNHHRHKTDHIQTKSPNGVNKNTIQFSLLYLSTLIAFAKLFDL